MVHRDWAQPHSCYQNAKQEQKINGTPVVSGWLVGEYQKDDDATLVLFHFWNVDADGNHYDTTPSQHGHTQTYEYVADDDVYYGSQLYANSNNTEMVAGPPCVNIKSNEIQLATYSDRKGNFVWMTVSEEPMSVADMMAIKDGKAVNSNKITIEKPKPEILVNGIPIDQAIEQIKQLEEA